MSKQRTILQILVPLVILGGGLLLAKFVAAKAKPPTTAAPPDARPRVRLYQATPEDVRFDIRSQGNVQAVRTADLSADVGGRIVATSAVLRAGGRFLVGEELLRLDPTDFELAIVQQEAAVARADLRLQQERAEAEAARRAWRELEGDRPADPLVLREPQIRDAEAELAAARALLAKRRLDLQRTRVLAPFAGRVQSVTADLGQTVQPGQRIATLLDTTAVEVPLPIPLDELAFVDLPLHDSFEGDEGPLVHLDVEFGGQSFRWRGRVVRIASEIDRRTRQMTVIARVDLPDRAGIPLLVGMFVTATIEGRVETNTLHVPRAAVQRGRLWVARTVSVPDWSEGLLGHRTATTLHERPVTVRRADEHRVWIAAGLQAGESVCVTPLDAPTDGMPVRVVDERGEELDG